MRKAHETMSACKTHEVMTGRKAHETMSACKTHEVMTGREAHETMSACKTHEVMTGREALEELIWPTRCVVCDAPGEILCASCRESLPWIEQRSACPVCGAPFGCFTCTACEQDWDIKVVCSLSFDGAGKKLPTLLKDAHELRIAPVMAAIMATSLDEADAVSDIDAMCFVPATHQAYIRRGFDHMELVASYLAVFLELPVADVLVRGVASDQRLLGREERRKNLAGTIWVRDDISGMRLLLADDVVTTGATMRACAQALQDRGAALVRGCALARVW